MIATITQSQITGGIDHEFSGFDYVLTDNTKLNETLTSFATATVTYSTIISDGYGKCLFQISDLIETNGPLELNVKEMRPPRMDDSGRTKYPVFFQVCELSCAFSGTGFSNFTIL